jgi:hypothetical protein
LLHISIHLIIGLDNSVILLEIIANVCTHFCQFPSQESQFICHALSIPNNKKPEHFSNFPCIAELVFILAHRLAIMFEEQEQLMLDPRPMVAGREGFPALSDLVESVPEDQFTFPVMATPEDQVTSLVKAIP